MSRITFAPRIAARRADDEAAPAPGGPHASTRRGLQEACELHFFRGRDLFGHRLDVDGVRPGGTYGRVFKSAAFPIRAPEEGIWFADLRANAPLRPEDAMPVLTLQALARTADGSDHGYIEVRAGANGWRVSERRLVTGMITGAHEAAQWRQGSTPRAPRVYVLARRLPAAAGVITFVDYRHLAFVLDGRHG